MVLPLRRGIGYLGINAFFLRTGEMGVTSATEVRYTILIMFLAVRRRLVLVDTKLWN